ncbi:hypothetical protein DPMN_048530 [Dreissena polymorpha]|uniref:Uncharacterized protein n=1 Tax=Dreissena polymorpha TaxID=45954 RepID=A0A9D4I2Z8_DREPO|nr:hypothetical protein DPMN_048530 [Dreissena polymorpha]
MDGFGRLYGEEEAEYVAKLTRHQKFHRIWILRLHVRGTDCRGEKHPRYLFRKREPPFGNEKLKSAFKKNKRLVVSSYTESVLVKEACSVIMQEATGCSYKEATEALQRTVAKCIFTAYSLATTHRSSIKEYWSSALADRQKFNMADNTVRSEDV